MSQKMKAIRGDTVRGTFTLRTKDIVDPTKTNNYVLDPDSILVMRWPGDTSTVTLSTEDSPEVIIVTENPATASFRMPPAKSDLLKVGNNLAVDVVETRPDGTVTTWEALKIVDIKDRENN